MLRDPAVQRIVALALEGDERHSQPERFRGSIQAPGQHFDLRLRGGVALEAETWLRTGRDWHDERTFAGTTEADRPRAV